MNSLITTIIIGVSLSMDAFSLSLIYGSKNLKKAEQITLSIIVGIYHFIMPIFGQIFGNTIDKYLLLNSNVIIAIIFILISVEMMLSIKKKREENLYLNIIGFLFFGLSVSLDSFTTGIGLKVINPNIIQSSTIFCITSLIFTYLGIVLGNKINKKYGNYSVIIGSLILFILGISYMFK